MVSKIGGGVYDHDTPNGHCKSVIVRVNLLVGDAAGDFAGVQKIDTYTVGFATSAAARKR